MLLGHVLLVRALLERARLRRGLPDLALRRRRLLSRVARERPRRLLSTL